MISWNFTPFVSRDAFYNIFDELQFKFRKIVAWITNFFVSLAIGFALIQATLTLPTWLGGQTMASIFGWIVVITTLINGIFIFAADLVKIGEKEKPDSVSTQVFVGPIIINNRGMKNPQLMESSHNRRSFSPYKRHLSYRR